MQSRSLNAAQHDLCVSMTVWSCGVLSSNMPNAKHKNQLILIILLLTKPPGMLFKHTPSLCATLDHKFLLTTHLDAYDKIAYDVRIL